MKGWEPQASGEPVEQGPSESIHPGAAEVERELRARADELRREPVAPDEKRVPGNRAERRALAHASRRRGR